MFYVKRPKAVLIRLAVYLTAIVLISAGYWFSGTIRIVYMEVNTNGSLGKAQLARESSWARPLFRSTMPDFLVVDRCLYLRVGNNASGVFWAAAKNRNKKWQINDLHDLRDKNPELQPYLKDLPPRQDLVQMKLE